MSTDQRHHLLIGGSHGIGRDLAARLEADGHRVTILSRTAPDGLQATHHTVDVTTDDLPDIEGPIHGLTYLPGSINLKPFSSLRSKDFDADWQVNVQGAVKVLQAYQKQLKQAGDASVVCFSTVAVHQGMPFHASIAASKGALEGLVRSLAAEWAPTVRVNAVAPSLTDTPLAEKLLRNDKQRDAAEDRHPLKRIGSPADIAEAAHYLLSDRSGWMTGQVLHVDGGMSRVRI